METRKDLSDYELILAYLDQSDQRAFEVLLNRYFEHTKKVLLNMGIPMQDVGDACQQVWIKIINALPAYKDEGKFGALVTTSAKNLGKDYWRTHQRDALHQSIDSESTGAERSGAFVSKRNTSKDVEKAELVSVLTSRLIPGLKPELRNAFLLKHEAEYWDSKRPLSWPDLSMLFGLTQDQVRGIFLNARDALVTHCHFGANNIELDAEELGVFLVWTQAQRTDKRDKQTELRLAGLLGIPVNTFKTRYKRAREALAAGLNTY